MSDSISTKNETVKVHLGLDIDNENFRFSTYIDKALAEAESELDILNETIKSVKNLKPECDKLDYMLAASSGALCGIIDIFLVGKPGQSPLGDITDKWFANRTMNFAKLCHPEHKNFNSLDSALRFLEDKFKVPYDQTGIGDAGKEIFGLSAKNHHFKSLAHNPSLLGLFFSILDQFTNSSHFVSEGQLISLEKAEESWELVGRDIPSKIFCGFVNWIGHLVSDISGSQSSARKGSRGMGIPSPLWTWTNDIIAIKSSLGIPVTDFDISVNKFAMEIFEQGYDLRFQSAQAIPVLINELLVRFIYSVRRLLNIFSETNSKNYSFNDIWKKCEPFSNPTVKRMLTVAHGTFCLVDAGDAICNSLISGAGTFNPTEFILHLNIIGVGRFSISLYGEGKRTVLYYHAKKDADFAFRKIIIIENYIEGLKILASKYDDRNLSTFIDDFKASDAYIEAFQKSVDLARLRSVPESKILKSKADIDKYFGGKQNV